MDEEIKISEMLEAESIYEEDFIPIIQNGINKKISASKIGTGNGIPTGGTTGQVLTKSSNEDNEVTWKDPVETQVINNLNSSSTTSALSANQGRALNNKIALVKEEIENKHTYSTEETQIGTWIDGKPIYRKVIKVSDSISTENEVQVNIADNIKEVIKIYGFCTWNNAFKFPIPYLASDNSQRVQIFCNQNKVGVSCYFATNFGTNARKITNVYAIMEYTKTTD